MSMCRTGLLAILAAALMAAGCGGDENKCEGVTCGANAKCDESSGRCACEPGFEGDPGLGCTAATSCKPNTCNGHGTCADESGTPVCSCELPWTGATCSECATGYVLVGFDCIADPCASENCSGHGTCSVDTSTGAAVCACAAGYAGPKCNSCAADYVATSTEPLVCEPATDPCEPNPCVHGTCTAEGGTANCACAEGWAGDLCDTCAEGYVLVGDACVANPCNSNPCGAHGTCSLDENNAAVCTCTDNFAGEHCDTCEEGYELVGDACVSDACEENTCNGHGTCQVVDGAATCTCTDNFAGQYCDTCAEGFVLVGGACVTNPCNSNPCGAHGTCSLDQNNAAVCTCTDNFAGQYCDTCAEGFVLVGGACVANPCDSDPCGDHGTCSLDENNAAVCTCTDHFAGQYCDTCEEGYVLDGDECVYDVPVVTIDWCHVQWPTSYTKAVGEAETIYGHVYSTSGEGTAAEGQLAGVSAKLCYSATPIDAGSDIEEMTCVNATFNALAADPGNNDEYQADLVINAEGTYYYLYAMSGDGGASWTLCETTDGVGNHTGPGVATITGVATGPSAQIAAVRATEDGAGLALPIDGAIVTFLKPALGTEPAGFFVQGDQTGPAIFVAVDPASLTPQVEVGDQVSFTVTELESIGGVKQVAAITNFSRASTGNDVSALVQNLTEATDLITALDSYESEAIALYGMISSNFGGAGTGHMSAQIETDGMSPDNSLKLRVPEALVNEYNLVQDCIVHLSHGVMWRYYAQAQPSAYRLSDFAEIECPAPQVLNARPTSATEVVVTFDRNIAAASVGVTDFYITDGTNDLAVLSLEVSGKTVVLTTEPQTAGVTYLIEVSATITDTLGTALASEWTGEFDGYAATTEAPVVISQLYPGGGSGTSILKYDYIELRNRTSEPIDLSGWSLQYASATGNFSGKVNLNGTIPANGYYLVQCSPAGSGGADLPVTADQTSTSISMSGTSGKLALVSHQTLIGTNYPSDDVIDLVGFGSPNYFEGAPVTGFDNSTALFRANGGCTDTNDNAADFSVAAPDPRNSSTIGTPCP
ncbi:MAG: lamin tail domain-containing protein [Myxococcales bacterium]|jgi:hypothetical protein